MSKKKKKKSKHTNTATFELPTKRAEVLPVNATATFALPRKG